MQVILDGNFAHALLQSGYASAPPPLSSGCYERRLLSLVSSRTATACRTQPADAVPKLLGGACKLCTSRCVLEELRRLGAQCEGAR